MRWLRGRRLRERGQSLVEFSVVGVIFFIVVFGLIDVGRAVWNYNTLAQATREGSRYAIVHGAHSSDPSGPGSTHFTAPNTDEMVTAEVQQYAGGLDESDLTVEAGWIDGSNEVGSRVQVTSRYVYEPLLDVLGLVSFTMSSSSTMRITY
jgi:Flp pilus assembly protein TadG